MKYLHPSFLAHACAHSLTVSKTPSCTPRYGLHSFFVAIFVHATPWARTSLPRYPGHAASAAASPPPPAAIGSKRECSS